MSLLPDCLSNSKYLKKRIALFKYLRTLVQNLK